MLKRFILWDYARASWQYDLMVGIILAFVFLTPRGWFRDQPRTPIASSIAPIPAEKGGSVFFVNAELLAGVSEDQRAVRLTRMLTTRSSGRKLEVTRVEPVPDSEGGLLGYLAFTRP